MRDKASLQILAVSLDGSDHESITHLQWQRPCSWGITTTQALIAWLREDPTHEAWLAVGEEHVRVEVVTPLGAPAHLRSRSEGQWGEHLLALPRF